MPAKQSTAPSRPATPVPIPATNTRRPAATPAYPMTPKTVSAAEASNRLGAPRRVSVVPAGAVGAAVQGRVAPELELGAGGPPQRPSAVPLAVVGEVVPGVAQQVRKQFGDECVVRQRDIEPPFRRGHGHPGQTEANRGRH